MNRETKCAISIIISLRNTKQYNRGESRLNDVLKSLRNQTVPQEQIELIVSDIDSDSGFRKKHRVTCKKYKARHIYTATGKLWNISRARNIGIQKSCGKYVMTTDVDCLFAPNFIETVLKRMTDNTIIHCRMTELPEEYNGKLDDFERMKKERLQLRPTHGYGSCQIVPRAWAFRVGGFDEEYETWGAEDTDYYLRAKQDGLSEDWIEDKTTYFHQWHSQDNRDEHRIRLAMNRHRCKQTEAGKLPIKRNPFGWGGVSTPSVFPDTAVLITTFLRDESLFDCVRSIRKYYPGLAIYVADGGNPTDEKAGFLSDHNCHHIKLPFDTGVCGSRNEALKVIPPKYKYILICEDDIVFTPESRIDVWRKILDTDPSLGIIGGLMWRIQQDRESIQHYEGWLDIKGETVFIKEPSEWEWRQVDKNIRYHYADIVLNVFLMRREVHDEVKWDAKIPQAPEHLDFFLSLKRSSAWKTGYTDAFQMRHVQLSYSKEYIYYRQRNQGFRHFASKHGIRSVYSDWHRKFGTYPDTVDYYEWKMKPGPALMHNLVTVRNTLEKYGIQWWLANGTCLGIIRDIDFVRDAENVDIALSPGQEDACEKIEKELKDEGFTCVETRKRRAKLVRKVFERDEKRVNIYVCHEHRGRVWYGVYSPDGELRPYVFPASLVAEKKEHKFKGLPCYIPQKAEEYLEAVYGKYWKIPNGKYKSWRDSDAIDSALFKKHADAFIPGVWETLHVGHLALFEKARSLNAKTIVGVYTDEAVQKHADAPTVSFVNRRQVLSALKGVDRIITLNDVTDFSKDLKREKLKPDYIISGDNSRISSQEKAYREMGCKIITVPRVDITLPVIKSAQVANAPQVFDDREKIALTVKAFQVFDGEEKIAIAIKTFMREECLYRTVDSFKRYMPYPYKFYIADDSPVRPSEKKEKFYRNLEAEGHAIIRLPHNVGLSVGRNAIVKQVEENYVLLTDDDIMLGNRETVKKLLSVLDSQATLGLVSSLIFREQGGYLADEKYQKGLRFEFNEGTLFRYPSVKEYHETDDGVSYLFADQVVNFFLARTRLFRDVKWDDRIKIEWEHIDFFLSLMKSRWKAAACMDTHAVHQTHTPSSEYVQHRRNAPAVYFLQKHGLYATINRFQ